jgi:hypothetical protein
MWAKIIRTVSSGWSVVWIGFSALAPLVFTLALPMSILFGIVVYAATYGADVPLKAACSDDTVFTRYKLLTGTEEFWREHIAALDQRIQDAKALPSDIEARVAEVMKVARDTGIIPDLTGQHRDQRTAAQRHADELRRQADAIEAREDHAAFLRDLDQKIAALKLCKARALEQLAK